MVTRKTTAKKITAAKMTAKAKSEAAQASAAGTKSAASHETTESGHAVSSPASPAATSSAKAETAPATKATAAETPKTATASAQAEPAASAKAPAKTTAEAKANVVASKAEPAKVALAKAEAPAEPKATAKTTATKTSTAKKTATKAAASTSAAAPSTAKVAQPKTDAEEAPAPKKTRTRKAASETSEAKASAAKTAAKSTAATKKTTSKTASKTTAKATKETKTASAVAATADHSSDLAQTQVKQAAAARTKARREKGVLGTAPATPLVEGAPSVTAAPIKEFADLPPVLIAAAESAPLAKTGGLADVVGALPKYLKELGVDARIIMPFHRVIKERYASQTTHLFDYNAGPEWASRFVGIDKLDLDGTIYYFVDNEYYFGGQIYSGDNFEGDQYGFFVQAVCDALPNLDFNPGIIHCNDWHTALLPLKLRGRAAREGYWPPALLLTIHNLAFQGWWGKELDAKLIGPDERRIAWDLGVWNMLKAGIDLADRVNTVSPTYANEICTPEFGEGLQDDLRSVRDQGRLWGILNGIDYDVWNPETDPCIPAHFNVADREGKLECKRALLAELGLDDDLDAPLIAFVGRLTPQKGVQLIPQIIDTCVPMRAKFVILGSGQPDLEWAMRDAENRYRGRVCSYIGYNSDLSHRIYAAADFLLMPSAFEPCGISQMIAMRYGTLPIVHEVGGLKDTVAPYNYATGEGDGFSFYHFDGFDATEAVKRALDLYWNDKDALDRMITTAMTKDFGFARCAHLYAELYRNMCS